MTKQYAIHVKAGTHGTRYVHLPHPSEVLNVLKNSARYDLLVTSLQESYIQNYIMYENAEKRNQAEWRAIGTDESRTHDVGKAFDMSLPLGHESDPFQIDGDAYWLRGYIKPLK